MSHRAEGLRIRVSEKVSDKWRWHFRDNAIEEIKRLDALLEYAV